MKNKIADLGDRSRHNDLEIRGVPETIAPQDLSAHVKKAITDAPSLSQGPGVDN